VGPYRRSGRFPDEIITLILLDKERRSPGNYAVTGRCTIGVKKDVLQEPHFMGKVRNLTSSIKQSRRFFFERRLVSVRLATNRLVSVRFESHFFTKYLTTPCTVSLLCLFKKIQQTKSLTGNVDVPRSVYPFLRYRIA
jgi:hypothetical protein